MLAESGIILVVLMVGLIAGLAGGCLAWCSMEMALAARTGKANDSLRPSGRKRGRKLSHPASAPFSPKSASEWHEGQRKAQEAARALYVKTQADIKAVKKANEPPKERKHVRAFGPHPNAAASRIARGENPVSTPNDKKLDELVEKVRKA